MAQPIFIVGDRVRMRHPAPHSLNATGTVTRVFGTAQGYYHVKFDTAPELRVVHASGMDHSPEKVTLEALFWTDHGGHRHHAPALRDLPLGLQLGITRMVMCIALSPIVRRKGMQAEKGQPEQLRAQAKEAVDILLCVLLPRLSNDEIDRRPYAEKRHFVVRWCGYQYIPFVVSA